MSRKAQYITVVTLAVCIPVMSYLILDFFLSTKQTTATVEKTIPEVKIHPSIEEKKEPITFLFVGDIMLDRTIRKDGELYGYNSLFECLKEPFTGYDAIIGNLEGTVTNFPSVSRDASYQAPESFRFTFDSKAVQALVDIGLSGVSLANNHIRDFGEEGIKQTIQNTKDMGLVTFGDPRPNQQRWIIQEIKGTKIAYIPYNQFFGIPQQVLDDLQTVQSLSDIQIIFPHWGDEYVPAQSSIKLLAHTFVDAGADLIIGGHPHVIQESEIYKTVPIYYSLGNFIFDQYFEEPVTKGLVLEIEIVDKKINTIKELKVESKRHEGTCFLK